MRAIGRLHLPAAIFPQDRRALRFDQRDWNIVRAGNSRSSRHIR
jgi:hypothetical protein